MGALEGRGFSPAAGGAGLDGPLGPEATSGAKAPEVLSASHGGTEAPPFPAHFNSFPLESNLSSPMQKERQVRIRLDRLLVERGLAETRAKAQAMILAGEVLVDEQKVEKCGALANAEAKLRLLAEPLKYVGRGGVKLEGALAQFGVSPEGKTCLDIGASTGGFTDCLLRQGASRVFAVDVGTNQLDWKLRRDPRVVSLEKINTRYLKFDQLGTRVALAVMDVLFHLGYADSSRAASLARNAGRSAGTGEAAIRGGKRSSRQGRHRARACSSPGVGGQGF